MLCAWQGTSLPFLCTAHSYPFFKTLPSISSSVKPCQPPPGNVGSSGLCACTVFGHPLSAHLVLLWLFHLEDGLLFTLVSPASRPAPGPREVLNDAELDFRFTRHSPCFDILKEGNNTSKRKNTDSSSLKRFNTKRNIRMSGGGDSLDSVPSWHRRKD